MLPSNPSQTADDGGKEHHKQLHIVTDYSSTSTAELTEEEGA